MSLPLRKSAAERLRCVQAAFEALETGDAEGARQALYRARSVDVSPPEEASTRPTPPAARLRLVTPQMSEQTAAFAPIVARVRR